MEEHNYERRIDRRDQKRKRKKRIRIVPFLFILLIGISVFSVWQYKEGYALTNAKDVHVKDSQFTGDTISSKNENVENILVLGVDSRGEEQSRSDTMILVSWNKKSNEMKLISFMRDIYADIPGYKSYKLNTAYYLGGAPLAKDTIASMFQVPIHHYALIDFKNFETLVDILAPDGVKINVEKDMSEKIGVKLTKGTQQLNGKELLGYARFRHDADGDFGRVKRQQQVLQALKDQLFQVNHFWRYPKFAGALKGSIQTDLSDKQQVVRMLDAMTSGKLQMESMTVPVEKSYSFASYSHAGSVIEINVDENRQAIQKFLND